MHLEAGEIQGALHGELPRDRAAALRHHLDTCTDCAAALAEAEREEAEVYGALMALDHPAPDVAASELFGGPERAVRPPLVGAPWLRWAAAIVLGVGVAGVAYAAPGSPIRAWIAALVERAAPEPGPASPAEPAVAPAGGGIGVAPGDLLVIELTGVARGAAVRVLFADAEEVLAGGGSGQVTFTLAPGRLLVGRVEADTIQLEIPRTAPRVEVRSDGRAVAVAERGALLVDNAALGGGGPFVLTLTEVSP
jgi:hypothetical protein